MAESDRLRTFPSSPRAGRGTAAEGGGGGGCRPDAPPKDATPPPSALRAATSPQAGRIVLFPPQSRPSARPGGGSGGGAAGRAGDEVGDQFRQAAIIRPVILRIGGQRGLEAAVRLGKRLVGQAGQPMGERVIRSGEPTCG